MIGMTIENAASPMIGTITTSISSVPYAEDEIMSGASTPIATGVDNRSWVSCSETIGGPRSRFLSRYAQDFRVGAGPGDSGCVRTEWAR